MNSPDDEIADRVTAKLSANAYPQETVNLIKHYIKTGDITVEDLLFDLEKIQDKLRIEVSDEN